MPKLYIDEYKHVLKGRTIFIACREGIFRDHFSSIIMDIKFLNRLGLDTHLFHNISNRFANQKLFAEIGSKLPRTCVIRVSPDQDFYRSVLEFSKKAGKIIFLERKYLLDPQGYRLNSVTTRHARHHIDSYGDLIGNLNFKSIIEQICRRIESGHVERVHILPAGKHSIKHELFTVEGSGTLIANNFTENFTAVRTEEDARIVADILKTCRNLGYLKPRSPQYIRRHADCFYSAKIDGIVVGCVEKILIDEKTVELAALAISTKFRNQRVGLFLIRAFLEEMKNQGYSTVISVTNNPKLISLYLSMAFEKCCPATLSKRLSRSPGKELFVKRLN
ncbi:MAG: GNAT family N-acetyltransferase [Desulfobacteraceae bacterium]|nr:GNAT family N-acetyltransferase [Desulfobacteraceae bacterium]